MRSDYIQAYINRGDILIRLNRTQEAQKVYERALQFDDGNPDIYYNVSFSKDFYQRIFSNIYLFRIVSYSSNSEMNKQKGAIVSVSV
ncbi:hypothetical protein TNCV_3194471 [Trichonephila clavipes]|uniref:Tetratricopeptide repeat protein n=1 Tax=Trichonephila clavipes TaxID=2585209 RepID=A0A8X6V2C8_TRICX|nr:hypothetical protein TNCV_3194471 [Trichonephila clavipes]